MSRLPVAVILLAALVLPTAAARAGGRSSKAARKRAKKPLALVLVLDRSGSMSGTKIARLRQATVHAISRLRSTDCVGVLAFDTLPRVVSKLTRVGSGKGHMNAVNRVTAGGGTAFGPALVAALRMVKKAPAGHRRHVLFLSDGHSGRQGVTAALAALLQAGAKVSTVALGRAADGRYLGTLARAGKGRTYQTTQAGLAAVFRAELRKLGR